ncbi:PTS sugar transporter subunit IIB [Pseudoflavonifractor capillosus]|uniref:PTS sugar transporter subunit IIB n=1 Tax=Pseudoflavonifractor capillosus TaxID=106588 RepID=UPI0023F93AFE|nr:PTS sugar transporter subunit IIB [Pseudoflavonifractor capillosus]MDY4662121.1 PTS sugar transporter subunit IIB [Pseudoflavonifractor capillosus]
MAYDPTRRYRFLCCCGCGLGSSQMLAAKLRQVCSKRGMKATVEVASVSEGMDSAIRYDAVFCNEGLLKSFERALKKGAKVYGLHTIMDPVEIGNALDKHFELT